MTIELTIDLLKTLNVVQSRSNKTENLYKSSLEKANLSTLDYMNIRDLLNISGYENDPSLIATLIYMFMSLNDGGLCARINKPHLSKKFERFLEHDQSTNYANEFIVNLNNNMFSKLITADKNDYFPIIRQTGETKDLLYFRKYFFHENSLEKHFKQLLNNKVTKSTDNEKHNNILDEIINKKPVCLPSGKEITLDPSQELAIRKTLTNNFLIISGGPGTGKTSILVNILRSLVRDGIEVNKIMLSAPTGRAAQRVTESVQNGLKSIKEPDDKDLILNKIKSSTIHRMLKYNPTKNSYLYNSGNQLAADVVVVDEVSMVDVVLMDNLFNAINLKNTKIILLGDRNQLPSVEAGAILSNLVPANYNSEAKDKNIVILSKDYRSKGDILKLSNSIINSNTPNDITWPKPIPLKNALQKSPGNCALLQCQNREVWIDTIKTWVDYFYCKVDKPGESYINLVHKASQINIEAIDKEKTKRLISKLFTYLENSIILSLVRESAYGCIGINNIIAEYLQNKLDPLGKLNKFAGLPILITRNNYNIELFNGEIGIMLKNKNGSYSVVFKKYGRFSSYTLESIPAHESAFAITVHKSQGSEFKNVMLVLPEDEQHPLLTREIIYTGITRAKNKVFIVGDTPTLNHAISSKIERESGLEFNGES